ncbi:MAG: hypothetical protein ACI8Y7_000527 [Candidatus Woesearchaeota archaeon]|jgi:hypothetical protein
MNLLMKSLTLDSLIFILPRAVSLLAIALLASSLSDLGTYAIIISWAVILSILIGFGLHEIPHLHGDKKNPLKQIFSIQTLLAIVVVFAALVTSLSYYSIILALLSVIHKNFFFALRGANNITILHKGEIGRCFFLLMIYLLAPITVHNLLLALIIAFSLSNVYYFTQISSSGSLERKDVIYGAKNIVSQILWAARVPITIAFAATVLTLEEVGILQLCLYLLFFLDIICNSLTLRALPAFRNGAKTASFGLRSIFIFSGLCFVLFIIVSRFHYQYLPFLVLCAALFSISRVYRLFARYKDKWTFVLLYDLLAFLVFIGISIYARTINDFILASSLLMFVSALLVFLTFVRSKYEARYIALLLLSVPLFFIHWIVSVSILFILVLSCGLTCKKYILSDYGY